MRYYLKWTSEQPVDGIIHARECNSNPQEERGEYLGNFSSYRNALLEAHLLNPGKEFIRCESCCEPKDDGISLLGDDEPIVIT